MDKNEFSLIAAAMRTYFPRYNMLPNAEAMELWYQELQDLPYELLSACLRKWVATEKWPPSIAELRAMSADMVRGPAPDWGDGWGEVRSAIQRFGYVREKEALASLSPAARSAAERIGWQDICLSENPEALRAQFRQIYQVIAERENTDRLIAPAVREMISGMKIGMLPGREGSE